MRKTIASLLLLLHPSSFLLAATARLEVHVADAGPQPGAALVRLTLTVTGRPLLQVGPASLADPVNAWQAERAEWCRLHDGRLTWTQSIQLTQTKPGPAALPDVKVRYRDGPSARWEEAEWVDLLKTTRDAPPPELSPAPAAGTSWPSLAGWAGLAGGLVALAGWALLRRRRSAGKPAAPDAAALRELQRLEAAGPDALPSAEYHTALSDVVRRYFADRFGLPATRRTTAEFLDAVARAGRMSADDRALLADFLGRCDLAKFAPADAPAGGRAEAAALARTLVERTAGTISAKEVSSS